MTMWIATGSLTGSYAYWVHKDSIRPRMVILRNSLRINEFELTLTKGREGDLKLLYRLVIQVMQWPFMHFKSTSMIGDIIIV